MRARFICGAPISCLLVLFALMFAGPTESASAQIWAPDINMRLGGAMTLDYLAKRADSSKIRTLESAYGSTHRVALGDIVEQLGVDTADAWQIRLNRNAAAVHEFKPILPRDYNDTGVDAGFSHSPSDTTPHLHVDRLR